VKTAPAAAAAAAARPVRLADTLEILTNHLTTTDVIKDNIKLSSVNSQYTEKQMKPVSS